MREQQDLELLLRSRTPLVLIESHEEPRILQLFTRLVVRLGHPMFQWTVTEGLRPLAFDAIPKRDTLAPDTVLKYIKSSSHAGYYLLLDYHPYLGDPLHIRLLKEIAQGYDETPRTLVLISHALDIPPELQHMTARFDLRLPDRATIKGMIREEAEHWQQRSRRPLKADAQAVQKLAASLSGVTASDARRLIRTAIEDDGAITRDDLPRIMEAKYQLMSHDGVISFEYDTARFADLAGLKQLKTWLMQRRQAFSGKSGNLDRPKGIMLLGIQGAGKSLAARMVAGTFGIPLLRLDFGSLYDKYYGETEKNLRRALETAETMAPCVLWIDEIEKGIAADDSQDSLSRRVLGSLLTWMAECRSPVFLVATSNDIQRLPPELIRKGRLDEIFFVDLPAADTRDEIFQIHLRQRELTPGDFDTALLVEASEGFTGAEIEQAVVSALYAAQAHRCPLDTDHLIAELERTRPLSVVMAEKVETLRRWAEGRTVSAN